MEKLNINCIFVHEIFNFFILIQPNMNFEFQKLEYILTTFLGDSKNELTDDSLQIQFNCPQCAIDKGLYDSDNKFNLEINLRKQKFNCWACGQHNDMHGSIIKLIKMFGNNQILKDYREQVNSIRQSKLYELNFKTEDFNIDDSIIEDSVIELPQTFKKITKNDKYAKLALNYIQKERNVDDKIIDTYNIGYTNNFGEEKRLRNRIVIPSYDKYGVLNYWTGRDFTKNDKRQKYCNPTIERKEIIFNECKVNWDADITLVEGPFDHIVVPNSIPLLGKALNKDFYLYDALMMQANAHVNIFLDGDAYEDVLKIYKILNIYKLYNRIRYIPCPEKLDPAKIFELFGRKGIGKVLSNSIKIPEIELL